MTHTASGRQKMKRSKLLENLEALSKNVSLDLPATIAEILAFGGILREKERLHDCDVMVLYYRTPEQEERWQKFRANFSTYGIDSQYDRYPLRELKEIFDPFIEKNIPLRLVVNDDNVANVLRSKGIPPKWAACFSWTELYGGQQGEGMFIPQIGKIISRILVGGKKGLHVKVDDCESFAKYGSLLSAKNYIIAWTADKPNVRNNIEDRSSQSRKETLLKELDHFVNNQIPKYRNGINSEVGYLKAKAAVLQRCLVAKLNINLENLDHQHAEIRWNKTDSLTELSQKCEAARIEMRKYRNDTEVLKMLSRAIDCWGDGSESTQSSREELISQFIIKNTVKKIVKEVDIREVLKLLGLPEDRVVTIHMRGYTDYVLAESEDDRLRLVKKAQLEELRKKYLRGIAKFIKEADRNASADLNLNENPFDSKRKTERKSIIGCWRESEFEVNYNNWAIHGSKDIALSGKEDAKALQKIVHDNLAKITNVHLIKI